MSNVPNYFPKRENVNSLGSEIQLVILKGRNKYNYRAFMRFFAGVSSHVHDKHILRFKWLFLPRALLPSADKTLFVCMNMIVIDVLYKIVLKNKKPITFNELFE
jgi:hypothetical protein